MTPSSPTTLAARRVPFSAFETFSKLFQQYSANYSEVAGFYAGDFRKAEDRRAAADRAAAHERDRATVADVLLEQNERWGLSPKTREHIEKLRDPETVAVVTGQQVGVLTGPLYTVYKTITALQLVEKLAEETGRPVVPVFWVEGEDHDFEEIAGVTLLSRNEPVAIRYSGHTPPPDGNAGAVGRLALSGEVEEMLSALDEALPPTDFKDDLMAKVREAYASGTLLEDAFVHLMRALFPDAGIVFLNPDDARLKALARPLFRREIEDGEAAAARVEAQSEKLRGPYHAQVQARPSNLFLLDDDGRYPLDLEDGRFTLRGQDRSFTQAELLDVLDETPERLSPNVILRPLMQDLLVPTAAYVAGPGEIAYFAQYKGVYDWAGIPMPIIYPRASVTLVEGRVQKVLDRYDLSVPDLGEELEKVFRRLVLGGMEDVEEAFKDATRHMHQAIEALKPAVQEVDRTLVKTAEATRAALVKEMERFKERVVKAEKRNQDEVRGRLEKAAAGLYPSGKLQERALSALYFLNKYSPDLIGDLQAGLSLDTTQHQVLEL